LNSSITISRKRESKYFSNKNGKLTDNNIMLMLFLQEGTENKKGKEEQLRKGKEN
jgi:hypothetical protein